MTAAPHTDTPPGSTELAALQQRCAEVRAAVLEEIEVTGSGHYGPALSVVEQIVALYEGYLRIRPDEPEWGERDRFILSKGHACSALYPVLADRGFFDRSWLDTFTKLESPLGDHPDMRKVPGVDFSSGSLGHGLSVAAGMAEALRRRRADSRVVCLLGDGECNEGQIWEAASYAAHAGLSRCLAVVDANNVSVDGTTGEVQDMGRLADRWQAFGWRTEECDGHDLTALRRAFARYDARRSEPGAPPTALIAHTVAGKGISFIEGSASWHLGYLAGEDRRRADAEVGAASHDGSGALR